MNDTYTANAFLTEILQTASEDDAREFLAGPQAVEICRMLCKLLAVRPELARSCDELGRIQAHAEQVLSNLKAGA